MPTARKSPSVKALVRPTAFRKFSHRCDGCGTYRSMPSRGQTYPCDCSSAAIIRPIHRQPIAPDDAPKMLGYPKVEIEA